MKVADFINALEKFKTISEFKNYVINENMANALQAVSSTAFHSAFLAIRQAKKSDNPDDCIKSAIKDLRTVYSAEKKIWNINPSSSEAGIYGGRINLAFRASEWALVFMQLCYAYLGNPKDEKFVRELRDELRKHKKHIENRFHFNPDSSYIPPGAKARVVEFVLSIVNPSNYPGWFPELFDSIPDVPNNAESVRLDELTSYYADKILGSKK